MSDVLAALEQLERAEKKKRPTDIRANTRRNASAGSRQRTPNGRQSRPNSLPPPRHENLQPTPTPSRPTSSYSERPYTPSLRKISFASTPRPSLRRLRIPTRTDALPSGFPYDSRLFKYGVTAEEWNHFSSEIVEAAKVPLHTHVPVLSWTWAFHKNKVTKGVKRQLLYESSDLMRELKRWNKLFKRQGFQVSLELPNVEEKQRGGEREFEGTTKEEKDQAKLEARRFRMVITPNAEKKPASIYSRSSSLTRAVTGEGAATTAATIKQKIPPPELEIEKTEIEGDDLGGTLLEPLSLDDSDDEKKDPGTSPPPDPVAKETVDGKKDESNTPHLDPMLQAEIDKRFGPSQPSPGPELKQDFLDKQDGINSTRPEPSNIPKSIEEADVSSHSLEPLPSAKSSDIKDDPNLLPSMLDLNQDVSTENHVPSSSVLNLESKGEQTNTIPSPKPAGSIEAVTQQDHTPHVTTDLKTKPKVVETPLIVKETHSPGSRGNSRSRSRSRHGEHHPQTLAELLTTSQGFDDWNNMDDEDE